MVACQIAEPGGGQGGSQGSQGSQGGGNQGGSRGSQAGNQGSERGFAAMDDDKQREIASKGGQAAHDKGSAHEFTSEEAREGMVAFLEKRAPRWAD